MSEFSSIFIFCKENPKQINDYIKNEKIEWHGDTTRSNISAELQHDLEVYAERAAFGGSIVEDKYKTSSQGIE